MRSFHVVLFQQVAPESMFQSGAELDVTEWDGHFVKNKITGIQPLTDFDLFGSSGLRNLNF